MDLLLLAKSLTKHYPVELVRRLRGEAGKSCKGDSGALEKSFSKLVLHNWGSCKRMFMPRSILALQPFVHKVLLST